MAKRKEKPTKIFREEVFDLNGSHLNSTRQTFDKEQFECWRALARENGRAFRCKTNFYIGTINWRGVSYR